jgi:Ca-activated chloride channel family protein
MLVLALFGVALLAAVYRRSERRREGQSLAYSNVAFVCEAFRPTRFAAAALFAGWLLGVAALGVALAAPHLTARVPVQDGVVMLCIDTSGSMASGDIVPTREAAARAAARAFIGDVPDGTRVGIVTFSTSALLVQPPTADRDAALAAVDRIPAPNGATAIGDALSLAAAQMPERGTRAVVLLTDGVNNHGSDPQAAGAAIGQKGIRIYTVGVGTNDSGQLIPGTLEPAEIDEDALRRMAASGGGSYFPAASANALRDIFRNLALQTVWESKRIDASLPFAFAGGALAALTLLAAVAAGRF